MRKPLIAGNWKMHGRRADLAELDQMAGLLAGCHGRVEGLICLPAPLVALAADRMAGAPVGIGAQDCSDIVLDGAFTGEISAAILADAGAAYVIVGHSERRGRWSENDALVKRKAEAVQAAGLVPIVCVGETDAARREGKALEVVWTQLEGSLPAKAGRGLVVAYEPVWAVGTDRTPTADDILDVHDAVRTGLGRRYGPTIAMETRILYGGSVNAKNAAGIFAIEGVDGALVGRASLKAAEYGALIASHPAA